MARTRRTEERVPGPADARSAAEEIFGLREKAPEKVVGQSVHLAIRFLGEAGEGFDVQAASFLCEAAKAPRLPGRRTLSLAPLDHPGFCPTCLRTRPTAHGSAVRVLTVLLTDEAGQAAQKR